MNLLEPCSLFRADTSPNSAHSSQEVASFDDHGPRQKDVQMSATPVQAQKADKAALTREV